MLNVLLFVFVKIPLLIIALIGAIRIAYFRAAFSATEAECVNSVALTDGGNMFRTTYSFVVCSNNVVETIERDIITRCKVDVGDTNKLLVRKSNPKDIVLYEKMYNSIALTLFPLILTILL